VIKKILCILAAALLLALPVLAQTDPNMGGGMPPGPMMPGNCPMGGMGGGMMGGMGGGQGMMGGGMMGPGGMGLDQCLMMHIQSLGLTEDQMSRLRTVMTDYQKERINLTSQIQVKEIDLHTMLMADNADMKKVEAQVRDINRVQGDLQLAGIRAFLAGKKILMPEQIRMLQQMMGMCMGTCPMMGGGMPMPMMGGPGMMGGMPGPGGMAPGAPMPPSPNAPMSPNPPPGRY